MKDMIKKRLGKEKTSEIEENEKDDGTDNTDNG